MKRPILLSTVLALSLSAATITLQEAPKNPERISPNPPGTILSYHDSINASLDSIVHIATTQKPMKNMMRQMHPYLEEFFGQQNAPDKPQKNHSLGSGVILSKDGYIVTNNHVVDEAEKIIVTIPNSNKEYEATLIGKDPKSDLAVIKIDAEDLKPITVGSSSDLEVGDVVFAIGNPFGIGQSVTQGIISASHKNGIGINEYENFIQTDASINPGNSGGALIDSRGALIGINTAIITRSGGNNGIGFAIEVDMVKNIVSKLIEHGSIERGYLGVSIGNLTKEVRKLYEHKEGGLLLEVHPDTPAAKAGLQRGDLIIAVDNKPVKNSAELKNAIGSFSPNTKVTITYERNKKVYTTTVILQNMDGADLENANTLLSGLGLADLSVQSRQYYRIPSSVEGVVITDVKADSEAEQQGIEAGDVIVQVEQTSITSIESLQDALKEAPKGFKRVFINRGGRVFMVALQ